MNSEKIPTEEEAKIELETYEQIYNRLKAEAKKQMDQALEGGKKKLTAEGRRFYIFPKLDAAGLDTWDKVNAEALKVYNKTSVLSKAMRESVTTLCVHLIREAEKITNSKIMPWTGFVKSTH